MAKINEPTDIIQVKKIHELALSGRAGAGVFRSEPVRISGSRHKPPPTWRKVMNAMEQWEAWSSRQANLPAPLRAIVLHAWLAHIHPFTDGNGRTCRAVSSLELIRSGYPSAIIRKKQDRDRYIDGLQVSDAGGDLGPFADLVIDRIEAALTGLEGAAREKEGYDVTASMIRQAQVRRLAVWNRSIELLYQIVFDKLSVMVENADGEIDAEVITDSLPIEDYVELCSGRPVSKSWAFRIKLRVPGLGSVERLAWIGYRSMELRDHIEGYAPSVFWSERNEKSYPPWIQSRSNAPGVVEFSISPGEGDDWHAILKDGRYRRISTTELAIIIARGFGDIIS